MKAQSAAGHLGFSTPQRQPFAGLSLGYTTTLALFFDQLLKTAPGQKIVDELKGDRRVGALKDRALIVGGGMHRFEVEQLASWYLWRANSVGEVQARNEMNQFLDSEKVEMINILFIYCTKPTSVIRLTETIELYPINKLPEYLVEDHFLVPDLSLGRMITPRPTAALVQTFVGWKASQEEPRKPGTMLMALELQRELHLVSLLLNCMPSVSCFAGFITSGCPSHVPVGPFGGRGGSMTLTDTIPFSASAASDEQCAGFAELFKAFRNIREVDQKTISSALQRFSRAKCRHDIQEKFLDLGIALEMILLNSEGDGQQLSLTFSLRGAWLIGQSVEERAAHYRTFREIYSLRSKIAHNGYAKSLEKMDSPEQSALVARSFASAESVFRHLLMNGVPSPAQWRTLVLGT